ncbi:hypothetical protein [Pseudophaeobacter leonis]|uniref:hypothetical protein n=1 Tax=Pseudophaeobacter leonis TaxID=1144477 RepID=UPI0013967389|nr:hypothetical protein [Pseudophaeobacter leonis]
MTNGNLPLVKGNPGHRLPGGCQALAPLGHDDPTVARLRDGVMVVGDAGKQVHITFVNLVDMGQGDFGIRDASCDSLLKQMPQ